MTEIFKTIDGFPDYEISNYGRVRTKSRYIRYVHSRTKKELFRLSEHRDLKLYKNVHGYLFCQLRIDKKSFNKVIHRLVANNFLKKAEGLNTVNHIDGNKINNFVDNLEWCTDSYNHRHAVALGFQPQGEKVKTAKLNDRCVLAIRNMLNEGFSHTYIASLFNISRPAISLISEGRTWKSLTGNDLKIEV